MGPLAWNANLGDSAQFHSAAMIAADDQQHELPGEPGLVERITAAGYTNWSNLGENIYAYSESAIYGHAGFMVDWGYGPDGMQDPAGHRISIMNASFREIGVDVTAETNPASSVGPQVVTQDLGARFNAYFVLGVAYSDSDGDRFYSLGEGRGNLAVTVGGASTTSAASGGYSLQVGTGPISVTLNGGGLPGALTVSTTVAAENIKLDVVDGNTLLSSGSIVVTSGTIAAVRGLGVRGLSLSAGSGNQTVEGTAGNDTLTGGAGDDTLLGSGGTDTAVYTGRRADYLITGEGQNYRLIDQRPGTGDGNDLAIGIERYQFADGLVLAANLVTPVNANPVALADNARTVVDTPVTLAVLANDTDTDADFLTVTSAGDPAHGGTLVNGDGTITYTPDPGFAGLDSFGYTLTDGQGGSATATVQVIVGDPRFQLFAVDGFVGAVRGTGKVFGANGFQDITILADSGKIALDGSFTRGNDIVRLEGDAASYTIERTASSAVLKHGTTEVTIPLGTAGLALAFDDGARELVFDLAANAARIGEQTFGAGAATIAAPADGTPLPAGADPGATGRLAMAQSSEVGIAGSYSVFGSNGFDVLHVLDGSIALDGSFSRGGDVLILPDAASDYQAYLAGSQLVLVGIEDTISIPIGTAGMEIAFSDDERTLRFDAASASVLLGDQQIDASALVTAEQLAPPGAPMALETLAYHFA